MRQCCQWRAEPRQPKDMIAVDDAAGPARLAGVARGRQVGDEPEVPEEQRDRGVGGDGEHVPGERALEVGPDLVEGRVRDEPPEEPGTPEVDDRVHAGHGHREQGHGLGEAVDRGAPPLLEEEQDGADQGAGVADADPPDEVGDVEGPADRDVVAPDADALEAAPGRGRPARSIMPRPEQAEQGEPALARGLEHRPEQALGEGAVVGAPHQHRRGLERIGLRDGLGDGAHASSGLGLRSRTR